MIAGNQFVIAIVIIPLFTSIAITIAGWFNKKYAWHLTNIGLFATLGCSLKVFSQVITSGTQHYYLSNWVPPFGIEYVVDTFNAFVIVMVATVGLLVSIYSKESIEKELSSKIVPYYTLFILLVAGLLGITITGDAFNLYVLLEIAALTSYALLAMSQKRAYFATFNYLIMGSIGACFYLLGVGYLLLKAGTLNMINLSQIIPQLHMSHALLIGFLFIMIGCWVKMALFPLHGWLPNVYNFAPTATSCLAAPLMTKVSVYVMIRMMFSVFGSGYVFYVVKIDTVILFLSVIAIVVGSLYALTQTRLKKMLTYLIIAEIGYMVGGAWLGNANGLTGAIYHIVADGLMTACLFMAVGCFIFKLKDDSISNLKGIFKKMPITMIGFMLGAFSMIGIPPTCGFFSKWYLLSGAYEAGAWHFFIALLLSSLVNAILFFRIIEVGFFRATSDEKPTYNASPVAVNEAPLTMTLPLLITGLSLIFVGVYTLEIVEYIIKPIIPLGFM